MATTTITVKDGPAFRPIRLYSGDSYNPPAFSIKIGGVAQTLNADTFKLRIQDERTGEAELTLTSSPTAGISFPTSTTVRFFLTASQAASLPKNKKLKYDFQWTRESDNQVKTLFAGPVTISTDVTP